jgi:hypothetical protein
MGVRSFRSPDGTAWSVWEVIPGQVSDFRSSHGSHLPRDMADGWLCFDCGDEKRRLAPLPLNWHARSDDDLWFWCRAAVPVRARAAVQDAAADADTPTAMASAEDEMAMA